MAGRTNRRLIKSKLAETVYARKVDERLLPVDFMQWPRARQLEWIVNMNMGQVAEICTWPVSELDGMHLAIWDRVRHGIWMVSLRLAERQMDTQEADERFRLAMQAAEEARKAATNGEEK